nr:helix-turn-helix domain-containing protein [Pseudomonas cavernicola]
MVHWATVADPRSSVNDKGLGLKLHAGPIDQACQRQCILAALEVTGKNWASAARLLGIDPSNLHKLARRLRLK